ncbi:RNA polymerase III transcription factor (TF)IIIC subunit [Handroanthus impetiginosus]|uniref:RNA polymerase III transcription factor (TF)IIIC subunit n=1 Tax=Handroanthus impetiginosus TaxID=429701 RepID=A0A2G9HWK6_9LAMI|nr:RNA polymerase III transcription factor (TF)IIIC subunit [Handroanthus impetiginosus]
MGVIKDGSISGVLPSSSEAFAVHYPGYPSSTERAIETLGGNQGILKVRTEKSNKLELHFRPEDPYSHPAFGELHPCNSFLLKLSRKKVKGKQNIKDPNRISEHTSKDLHHLKQISSIPKCTETTETTSQPECESFSASSQVKAQIENGGQEQLSADIVAGVSEAYHFSGLVDYQHVVAVHADLTRRKKRTWSEIEPHDEGGLLDVDQEDLLILVPPLFSLKDLPEKVALKPTGDMSLKKKQEGVVQQHSEMEIEQCLAIDFNIKEIPKEVNWEKSIPRDSDRWQWQMAVCELFDERPIWVKASLAEHLLDRGLNVGNKVLKRLLFIAAYYFSNGPYRRFWIRKGYDPRKDPESRIYQRTDFRVPPPLRGYCYTNVAYGLRSRWEDICAFRVFPCKSQILLQLFELKDDYIQEEIRKPPTQGNCSLQTGWFSSHLTDSLRLRVAQRFLSVYPEPGAESLLKSVSNRFERSKRLLLNLKDSKVDGEGKQADKEVLESEDKEEDKEVNDEVEDEEDEEDEMEDDNLGEGVDADEELDLVDQDMDFPLPDSYTDHDNISKDYLQELFGSFPFGAAGGDELHDDTDPYDGGYQIYDDDNYSDDEDY